MTRSLRPAVFLDRDGTIIEHVHYIARPDQVRLLPAAAEALRALRGAGLPCIVVSNQSAVGRGLVTPAEVEAVQRETERRLGEAGAAIDGWYYCPVTPSGPSDGDRTAVSHPDRKPGPGLLLRAAAEHALDVAGSWMVGDLMSDLLAGRNAGVRGTVLVRTGQGTSVGDPGAAADHVAADLLEAARWILSRAKACRTGASAGTEE